MNSPKQEFPFSHQQFDALRQKARAHTGIQVPDDKFQMYYSRLVRMLRKHQLGSFDQLIEWVEQSPDNFTQFINAITTNVTSFGREQHHFDYLKDYILRHKPKTFRIWSAGCSSGQEPYTLIVNCFEACQASGTQLSIHATDLDSEVLKKAQNGVYPLSELDEFSLEQKRRFFLKGTGSHNGMARVKAEFRHLIAFSQLNLIKPWQHKEPFDVIFCRNVIIYFDTPTKQQLVNNFANTLLPNGHLFLGHSETLGKQAGQFEHIGKTIYRKRS